MNTLRIYIEDSPIRNTAKLFVFSDRVSYHLDSEGNLIATTLEASPIPTADPKPFLSGPSNFIQQLASAFAVYIDEQKGGLYSLQAIKGKCERGENEVQWLRSLIEKQFK